MVGGRRGTQSPLSGLAQEETKLDVRNAFINIIDR